LQAQWPYGWGNKPQGLAGTTNLLVLLEKEAVNPYAAAVALSTMAEDWNRHESDCNPDGADVAGTLAALAKVHDLLGIEMPAKIREAHNLIRTRGMGALEKLCETRHIAPERNQLQPLRLQFKWAK
jgi:hypothetical protein